MNDRVDVDFGGWISKGCGIWKENLLTLILAGALVFFIGVMAPMGLIYLMTSGLALTHPNWFMFITTCLNIIPSCLLAAPLFYAYVKMVLAIHDQTTPKPQVTDVFQGFSMLMPAALYMLVANLVSLVLVIISLIGCIGAIIQIVGMIAFTVLTCFGMFFLVDKKLPVMDAYKASIETVKKSFFPMLGLVIVAALIGASGVIACGIGVFVTLPINFCIMAVAFRAFTGGGTPPTGSDTPAPTAPPPPIPGSAA